MGVFAKLVVKEGDLYLFFHYANLAWLYSCIILIVLWYVFIIIYEHCVSKNWTWLNNLCTYFLLIFWVWWLFDFIQNHYDPYYHLCNVSLWVLFYCEFHFIFAFSFRFMCIYIICDMMHVYFFITVYICCFGKK